MKLYQIINAYSNIGDISLFNLDDNDIDVIMDFRGVALPFVNSFNELQKDAADRLKPAITDDMSQGNKDSLIREYTIKYNRLINDELNKEVDIKISDKKTSSKVRNILLKSNKITVNQLDSFRFLLG